MFSERLQSARHEASADRDYHIIFSAVLGGRDHYYSQFLNWQLGLRVVKLVVWGHTASREKGQDLDVSDLTLLPYSEAQGSYNLLVISS